MPLTDVQLQHVRAWLTEKGGLVECMQCRSNALAIQPDLFAMPTVHGGAEGHAEMSRASGAAVVAVNCLHCGHIELFSATTLGVVLHHKSHEMPFGSGQGDALRR